jgi:hypothetical protein
MKSVESVKRGARGLERAGARDVVLACVAAQHALEDAVRARLHRQVHVGREHVELGVRAHERVGHVARVRRRVAEAREPGDLARDVAEQARELRLTEVLGVAELVVRVVVGERARLVPGVHGLPEERHLAHAALDERADLADHVARGAVALGPARGRHDAEGAALVAALHDGDERAHLAVAPRQLGAGIEEARVVHVEHGARDGRLLALHVGDEAREVRDVVGPEHDVDVRDAAEQLGALLLRDAAGHREHHAGALFLERLHRAEEREELVLGLLAHAARVDDDEICELRVLGPLVALSREDLLDATAVVHVHLAAVRLDEIALHGVERATISPHRRCPATPRPRAAPLLAAGR